jgi:hypothetical protein
MLFFNFFFISGFAVDLACEKGARGEGQGMYVLTLPSRLTGGGIVFDSDPYDEWVETMNKLGANMQCISSAEKLYTGIQQRSGHEVENVAPSTKSSGDHVHIVLVAQQGEPQEV